MYDTRPGALPVGRLESGFSELNFIRRLGLEVIGQGIYLEPPMCLY